MKDWDSHIHTTIYDWFFFIFSPSSLKFSLCSSIIFPNSVSILITNALNSLSDKLFISVLLFFPGFSLVLSSKTNSSVFLFCSTFSVSMELGETVTYFILKGVSFCENVPLPFACAQ